MEETSEHSLKLENKLSDLQRNNDAKDEQLKAIKQLTAKVLEVLPRMSFDNVRELFRKIHQISMPGCLPHLMEETEEQQLLAATAPWEKIAMKTETATDPLTICNRFDAKVEEDLQELCYMATDIKQLLIEDGGGTFTLGNGDATLEFPPGAVKEQTPLRYAIILHGPFVFPDGSKPGSVIVYINMNGATLLKPLQLTVSHWCSRERDENTLKFIHAQHTLEAGKQTYTFGNEDDEADFTTYDDKGVLTIREPHCLYCVKSGKANIARYSAITFTLDIPEESTLLFRIQLICDSNDWDRKMTSVLVERGWKKINSGDIAPQFCYAPDTPESDAKRPRPRLISATPTASRGPGWIATIEGAHDIKETAFPMPIEKSKSEFEKEAIRGYYPPCFCYKILYTSPKQRRVNPAFLRVHLNGADVDLTFNCIVMEDQPAPSGSRPCDEIIKAADVIGSVNHQLDAHWREFGTFLSVDHAVLDSIRQDESRVSASMLSLVQKWLDRAQGTGKLPRTWETVVQAVRQVGKGHLAEQLAEQHRV